MTGRGGKGRPLSWLLPAEAVLLLIVLPTVINLVTDLVPGQGWWRWAHDLRVMGTAFVVLAVVTVAVTVVRQRRLQADPAPQSDDGGTAPVFRGQVLTGDGATFYGPVLTGDGAKLVHQAPPPEPAGIDVSRIATANEATAAWLVETGEVDAVTAVLAGMNPVAAAAILGKVIPEQVGSVLAAMNEQAAAGVLRRMDPRAVGSALRAIQPADAARLLPRLLPDSRQGRVLNELGAEPTAAILQQLANWQGFLGGVSGLDVSDLVGVLAAMPAGSIPTFFADPGVGSTRCARVVAAVSPEQAALIIRNFPADQSAHWLGLLAPAELVAAVENLQDGEIVDILEDLPLPDNDDWWSRAFVSEFGEERLVGYLIRLPTHKIAMWRRVLHTYLTTPARNRLDAVMREGSPGTVPPN
jgi:hypothetical protein